VWKFLSFYEILSFMRGERKSRKGQTSRGPDQGKTNCLVSEVSIGPFNANYLTYIQYVVQ
jgi:hypothetical protein